MCTHARTRPETPQRKSAGAHTAKEPSAAQNAFRKAVTPRPGTDIPTVDYAVPTGPVSGRVLAARHIGASHPKTKIFQPHRHRYGSTLSREYRAITTCDRARAPKMHGRLQRRRHTNTTGLATRDPTPWSPISSETTSI